MPRFGKLICSSTTVRKPKIFKMKVFSNYFLLYNFKFTLFRFRLGIFLYIYNPGFLSISTCFGPIGPSSGESNALIAQAASGTAPSVVVCLAWPLVLD
jgi:hypothetical protein